MGRIGDEHFAIHCPIQNHRCGNAGGGQCSHQCRSFPVSMGNGGTAPLAAFGAASCAGHLGVGAAFINEEQPLDLKIVLIFKPGLTRRFYIVALLLAGMGSLF